MPYIGAGVQRFNTADNLTVTGTSELKNDVTVTGDVTASGTVLPTGDTAAGDAAALGFTSAEGLILTGQGSTSDVTIKNDADATVAFVPTGADDLRLPDNAELQFGDSADLKIYHNGSTSFIEDVGTGNFLITTNGNNIQLMKDQSEQMLVAKPDDAVELYYDNAKKFETTSTGVSVTGQVIATKGSTGTLATFTDGVATNFTMKTDGNSVGTFGTEAGSTQLALMVANTEAARFDGSRNLLVAKTSLEYDSNAGHIFRADGLQSSIRSGGNVADFNRLSDDGEVIRISKDGTTVGSISAGNGDLLIGTGAVNLRFFDATPAVIPRTAADATSNGVIDIGNTSNHFQNAYFTGTVFAESFTGRDDTNTSIQMAGSDHIKFFTGGTERMRVNASGHINIGQTSTNIPGQNNTQAGISLRSVGDGYFSRDNDLAVNANRNGGDGTCISLRRGGTQVGAISVTSSSTTYNTSSDARLKSNIEDAASASDKIDAIQVRQFDWNETGNHQDYGLIAQELQSIEPMAVTGDADSDDMMGVDYSKLVPMLIKAVQEQQATIKSLETRLAALES